MTKDEILGNLGILLLDIIDKSSSALLLYKQLNKTDNGSCIIRVLDNDILHNDFTGGKGGEEVPPKYADGSFRQLKYCLEYKFMHLDNKRHSVYGKTKEICWEKRTQMIAGQYKSICRAAPTSQFAKTAKVKQTYGELLTAYFERKKARKPPLSTSAIENIERCIRLHISDSLKSVYLDKLQPYMFEDNLYNIDSSRMREYTYTVFTGSLRFAKANNLIKTELWRLIEHEKHKSKGYRPLEDSEYQLMLEKADPEMRRVIIGYCWTGCRRNELLSIKYKDIYNNTIRIWDEKNDKWKEVPVFPPLAEIIGQGKPNDNVFNMPHINERMREFCNSLGLNDISPHNLRNFFGSILYDNGVDMKDIQAWLGHSTLKVTQDIYTKRRKSTENQAIKDIISKIFTKDSTPI